MAAVAGFDLAALLDKAAVRSDGNDVVLLDFKDPSTGDQIRILVE